MQNSQVINWWEILKVAIPSLVALVVPLLTYLWLTRKMADYQTNLSKELESYKVQLQSEFQTKFYEFQTKFSWFHQKKAETIDNFFAEFLEIQYKIVHFNSDVEDDFYKLRNDFDNFITFYIRSQLYFDDELCQEIESARDSMSNILDKYNNAVFSKKDKNRIANAGSEMIETHKVFRVKTIEDRKKIEKKIRKILSTEFPNNIVEKK